MLGVFINVITVILGSSVGLLFKNGIPERVSKAAMVGLGACTLYIGISGSLSGENVLILIASVVLGAVSGTLWISTAPSAALPPEWRPASAKTARTSPSQRASLPPRFCSAWVP